MHVGVPSQFSGIRTLFSFFSQSFQMIHLRLQTRSKTLFWENKDGISKAKNSESAFERQGY